jgi:isocitrate dehydrogenase kinase/phosphatase
LLGNPKVRTVFMKHHADLLEADFWQEHQARIKAGHVHDVFPYEPASQLRHMVGQASASL